MLKVAAFVLIALLMFPFAQGLASSYGEGKVILRTEVPEGETVTIDRSIRLRNINDIPIKVTLEPTERFGRIVEMLDKEVVLEPGETKRAEFTITLKSGGRYEGKIMLTFEPEDPEIEETSVGGSSSITIIADGPVNEHYYEVMGEEDEEGLPEATEPETSEKSIVEVDSPFGDEPKPVTVEVEQKEEPEQTKAESGFKDTIIGVLVTVSVVVIGLGGFFLAARVFKK